MTAISNRQTSDSVEVQREEMSRSLHAFLDSVKPRVKTVATTAIIQGSRQVINAGKNSLQASVATTSLDNSIVTGSIEVGAEALNQSVEDHVPEMVASSVDKSIDTTKSVADRSIEITPVRILDVLAGIFRG